MHECMQPSGRGGGGGGGGTVTENLVRDSFDPGPKLSLTIVVGADQFISIF